MQFASQLRFLAGRQVGMDDALGGGLVQFLRRQVEFLAQLLDWSLFGRQETLDLRFEGFRNGAIVKAAFVGLALILFGAAGMRHRSSPCSLRLSFPRSGKTAL